MTELDYSAYFFDLGGTLLAIQHDEIAQTNNGRVMLLPGVRDVLNPLRGKLVFVITNQAGVALGYLTGSQVRGFIEQLDADIGHIMTDYRICMHHPAANCLCRKPRPGMILDLAKTYDIDLSTAVMVGDTAADQSCAQSAGIGTFHWSQSFFGGSWT